MTDTIRRYEYDNHRNIDASVWVITWACVFALWGAAIIMYRDFTDFQVVARRERADISAELNTLKAKLRVEPWEVMEQLKQNEQILHRIEDKLNHECNLNSTALNGVSTEPRQEPWTTYRSD